MSFAESLAGSVGEAALVMIVALVVGLIVDQLLFRVLSSQAGSRSWAAGRAVAKGLHGLPTVAGALIGAWLALTKLTLGPKVERMALTTISVLAILAATAFAARILAGIVGAYTEREGSRLPSTTIFVNLARGLVWVLGGVMLLGTLGVSIAPLITALGVGGLAVGLALQPTLENVFSGIQVLASRQIEPGDLIRLETGDEGTVLDVTWRNTAILTPSNDVVIVPNAVLGRAQVTNFTTLDCEHVVVIPVSVSPDADLALVERCAREVAETVVATCEGAVSDAEPAVRFAAVTTSGVQVNTAIWVRSYPDRLAVRHEFIKQLLARFEAEGVLTLTAAVPSSGASPTT